MKIIHLSDTHGAHHRLYDLPQADVVVHSGDFTMTGDKKEALDFLEWFCDLPHPHKIFICGNHDDCLHGANIDGLDANVYYLNNSCVKIDGIKFYGVPMFMSDCISGRQNKFYENIPCDTDILITHSPAFGILDLDDGINYGSEELASCLRNHSLRAHLFGHIHAQHNIKKIGETIYSNGAIMNSDYSKLNHPNLIEI